MHLFRFQQAYIIEQIILVHCTEEIILSKLSSVAILAAHDGYTNCMSHMLRVQCRLLSGLLDHILKRRPEAKIQSRVMPCQLTFWRPNGSNGVQMP